MSKPIVAIVGRPNVGKSTLFNRLTGEQRAVVDDVPGTTRDRLVGNAEWNGVAFYVVDTGGIEPLPRLARGDNPLSESSTQFIPQIRAQAELAIQEADVVIFMTEVSTGITAADREVAEILRRYQKRDPETGEPRPPVVLAVNKSENLKRDAESVEFYALGMGEPFPLSAMHGIGTGELLDALVAALPKSGPAPEEDSSIKIAIVGRPNVGKSSLLNRLLGEDRVIVSPIPGTTRDAVDTPLIYNGIPVTLIDTAGMRRRGHIDPGVEKWSVLRALKAISRADVALLVVDATEPFTAQDTHVAGFILDELKSVVVIVNKWDVVEKDEHTLVEYTKQLRIAFSFMDYVPVLFISAKTGQRCGLVLPTALEVQEERLARVPTSKLNQLVRAAVTSHPPKAKGSRVLKITYAAQVRSNPPTFLFHVNDPDLVHFSYERYLENCLRREYRFLGTPVRLSFRKKNEK